MEEFRGKYISRYVDNIKIDVIRMGWEDVLD